MKPSIEFFRVTAVILITFTHTKHNIDSGILYFLINKLPPVGTAILSIISGYLYFSISRNKKNLFLKKIKSLAIPYIIANTSILLIVLILNYFFDYNMLNRFNYDFSIITDGIFSLHAPPINPPTYFIRDIFVIFSIIALFSQKEHKALIVLIPILLFGILMLRLNIAFLFALGLLYANFKEIINKNLLIISTIIVSVILGIWFTDYMKFSIAFLIFILFLNVDFKFPNTGRYSYLLHLYHAPIIVISYPILNMYIESTILNLLCQLILSTSLVYILFLLSKKYSFLRVLSGGR